MLIAPQEGKGTPISQMHLSSRCAYNRIVGSRSVRKTTVKLQKWKQGKGDFSVTFEVSVAALEQSLHSNSPHYHYCHSPTQTIP